jgi:hypothetical protein
MENENQSQFENFENQLTASAIRFLKESAKWCKFISIVGFVGIGLMVLLGLFMMIGFSAFDSLNTDSKFPFPMSTFSVVYLIFAAIYFFPIYYLYQYASKTTKALQSSNQQLLTDGLENLKSHHKFLGIFTLIIVSLYALIFILALLGGLISAAN